MERAPSERTTGTLAQTLGETQSPVAWGAIFAGAAASLSLSFVLMNLALGFGLQLSTPWPRAGLSAALFSPTLGATLIAIQVVCSALGGYLAGRLRTKWLNVHDHEVHFRDTAHGFTVWAVSTLVGLALATTALTPERPVSDLVSTATAVADTRTPLDASVMAPVAADPDAAIALAREQRDMKIAGQGSLYMAIGLLLSAFVASVAAAIGGLRRDEMHATYRRLTE